MVQFLDPETAKLLQFLDPEIVEMDKKIMDPEIVEKVDKSYIGKKEKKGRDI